ncbi:MAG TPA: hypothetical protein VFQ53_10295 [Kofleriaceae bacterium]|nr:hypothetical protein [Kofleriaceae bacterium]
MKKCASCTKDLPDAALHCVFCGAKQPPAPATAGGVAKTVMGHASSEMIEQLKAQQAAAQRQQAPANLPSAAPYAAPPRPSPSPTPGPPMGQPYPPPSYGQPPVPAAGAVAPTMFVPGGGGPPGGGYQQPPQPGPQGYPPPGGGYPPPGGGYPPPGGNMPMGGGTGPMGGGGMQQARPHQPTPPPPMSPAAPIPTAQSPWVGRTNPRAGRPIEPWKDSLRLMMFIWGGVLLLAFMTPVSGDPLRFMFQAIADAEGTAKLEPLIMAAVGLLSIVLAAIPMSPPPRGLIAGILGFAGIVVPLLIALSKSNFDMGQAFVLLSLVGMLVLIPGLLLRNEYRDSIMPRLLVTIGVVCILVPQVVPQHDAIPIVETFKQLGDAPGKLKIGAIMDLLPILLALVSLLCWLPAPSSGLGKVLAWCWILLPAAELVMRLIIGGEIGSAVKASPYGALMAWAPFSSYMVLVGYGFATVFGKQLE